MNKTMLLGLALIVLGALALGYEGISYMSQEKVVDIGPLKIDVEKKETIPVPRVVGIVFVLSGIGTAIYAAKNRSS